MNLSREWLGLMMIGLLATPAAAQAGEVGGEEHDVVVFGTETFLRAAGGPRGEARTFSVPAVVHGPFTLVVDNGEDGGAGRVSSGRLRVNGVEVLGPSDLNQQVARRELRVALAAENTLEVELASAPGGFLGVTVLGKVAADLPLDAAQGEVDALGGEVSLPGLAVLAVPAGAIGAAQIDLTALASPIMDFLAPDLGPSIGLLGGGLPAIRIKSSAPFAEPVALRVEVPDLAALLPPGREPLFVALKRQSTEEGETIDSLIAVGGGPCGDGTAVCATLLPEWFDRVNPFDPADPVLQVTIAAAPPLRSAPGLWSLSGTAMLLNGGPVSGSGPVRILPSDTLEIATHFELRPAFPLPFAALPLSYLTPGNLASFVSSGFGTRIHPLTGLSQFHGGLDLRTLVNGVPATGLPVSAVQQGAVAHAGIGGGGYGNLVVLDHGSGIETRYAHLLRIASLSSRVMERAEVGRSGRGGTGPHLHFETRLLGQPIDPVPLLAGDLGRYLPIDLFVALDGSVVAPVNRLFVPDHDLRVQIPVSQLQPGTRHVVSLSLGSPRLGVHLLQGWSIDVARDFTLTVSTSGAGRVVSPHPGGIDCGAQCRASYPPGQVVILDAQPGFNHFFAGWGGDCASFGTRGFIGVTMTDDKSCSAPFQQPALAIAGASCSILPPSGQFGIFRYVVSGTVTAPDGYRILVRDDHSSFNILGTVQVSGPTWTLVADRLYSCLSCPPAPFPFRVRASVEPGPGSIFPRADTPLTAQMVCQ